MFLSFYTFIILIVQVTNSVDVNNHQFLEPLKNKETLLPVRHDVIKKESKNKRDEDLNNEVKLFDYIQEKDESSTPKAVVTKDDRTLVEVKTILQKLLKRLSSVTMAAKEPTSRSPKPIAVSEESIEELLMQKKRGDENEPVRRRSRWGQWTPWSSCSVTCGKGREIRWRHCLEQCETAETEMEEKTCQLPACAPGKIFGIKL